MLNNHTKKYDSNCKTASLLLAEDIMLPYINYMIPDAQAFYSNFSTYLTLSMWQFNPLWRYRSNTFFTHDLALSLTCDLRDEYTHRVRQEKRATLLLSISSPIIDRFSKLLFFTSALCRQFTIMWLLHIPWHGEFVSTLPCKISMKYAYITITVSYTHLTLPTNREV